MSLINAINSAISGLQVSQTALQIASNNIANVNTEGFTRKTANIASRVVGSRGGGAEITSVTRTVNDFLIRQSREQGGTVGRLTVQSQYLGEMQTLFGTPADNSSIPHRISRLAEELDALSSNAEDPSMRAEAVSRAQVLAGQINSLRADIQELRSEADLEILSSVTEINNSLARIAQLNANITRAKALGEPLGDLKDQRDIQVNKVAEQLDIRYFERANGEMVVLTGSARQLVDADRVTQLSYTPAAGFAGSVSYVSATSAFNTINGLFVGTAVAANDLTNLITDGRLRGLIQLRDTELAGQQSQLDQLTSDLRDTINASHNNGVAFPPPAVLTGTHSFVAGDVVVPAGDTGGTFRIAIVDRTSGAIPAGPLVADVALGAGPLTVNDIVVAINGAGLGAIAALNASGQLVLTAPGANQGIAINEGTSSIRMGAGSRGVSHFFGLNDLFTNSASYSIYDSDAQTATATFTGTLSFQQAGAAVNVAVAGQTIEQIATAINGTPALTAAGIAATVISDGSGHRLRVTDAQDDHITVFGGLAATLGMNENVVDNSASFVVEQRLLDDPNLLVRGSITDPTAALPAAGDIVTGTADGAGAAAMAQAFSTAITVASAGTLPALNVTIAEYATQILSAQATRASTVESELTFASSMLDQVKFREASVSAVNLDEELAMLVELENAYAASSRLITVADQMFDALISAL